MSKVGRRNWHYRNEEATRGVVIAEQPNYKLAAACEVCTCGHNRGEPSESLMRLDTIMTVRVMLEADTQKAVDQAER
jgi:hypothetical protein